MAITTSPSWCGREEVSGAGRTAAGGAGTEPSHGFWPSTALSGPQCPHLQNGKRTPHLPSCSRHSCAAGLIPPPFQALPGTLTPTKGTVQGVSSPSAHASAQMQDPGRKPRWLRQLHLHPHGMRLTSPPPPPESGRGASGTNHLAALAGAHEDDSLAEAGGEAVRDPAAPGSSASATSPRGLSRAGPRSHPLHGDAAWAWRSGSFPDHPPW